MRTIISSSLLLLLMMPLGARAAVIINEIAWMGDSVSANHEWLELYNGGDSAVSLDGWMLKDGLNLEIPLSGNIGAKDYALLERTSEDSAPGTAFLIYTGALVNTGATLTLYNDSNEVADQVAGGENWAGVGGDNTTKETAQYNAGGWVTDKGTPGAVNKSGREELEIEDTSAPITTSTSNTSTELKAKTNSNKNDTVRLVTLDTELKLKLDFQNLAYVNQPINFSVAGSGIGESIINSLNYTWNFGDTNTAPGKKATHAYAYPGTYVVTLRANFARHNQVVRQEITVLPVTFSITKNEAGNVQIHNDAPYDVELSGFMIRGNQEFVFPPDTIIIPRGTITIKASKLGINNLTESVALLDQKRTLVASSGDTSVLTHAPVESMVRSQVNTYQIPKRTEVISARESGPKSISTSFDFVKPADGDLSLNNKSVEEKINNVEAIALLSTPEALADEGVTALSPLNKNQPKGNNWAYLVLIGLLFLGFVGLLLRSNNSVEK